MHKVDSVVTNFSCRVQSFLLGNKVIPRDIMNLVMSFLNFQNHLALYAISRSLTSISSLIVSAVPSKSCLADFNRAANPGSTFDLTDSDIFFLNKFPLKNLNLNRTSLSNAGFIRLRSLTSLQSLSLLGVSLTTPEGWGQISQLSSLRSLNLAGSTITDVGLGQLSHLTSLQSLHLGHSQRIQGSGLVYLSLLSSLRTLILENCYFINEECMNTISNFRFLNYLNINQNLIKINYLEGLSRMTSLRRLDLNRCPILDDNVLKKLSNLTFLNRLELMSCAFISDEGIKNLSTLVSLRYLDLRCCPRITEEGLMSLSNLNSLKLLHGSPFI